jgi:hypothetical protein
VGIGPIGAAVHFDGKAAAEIGGVGHFVFD